MITGYRSCLALSLRTAWRHVVGWPVLMTALVASAASTLRDAYPSQAGRDAYEAASQAMRGSSALQGRGHDLSTLGGILANEMGYLTLIMIPLIGLHLAIRFTRTVEDDGRLDILTAGPIHRLAPAAAGVLTAAVSAVLTVVLNATALTARGFPAAGSLAYAGSLGMFMLVFTAIGTLAAQCCSNARTAYGLAIGCWLATYLARAVVDARGWNLVWANPESWLAAVQPFATAPPSWPWFAFLALTVALFGAAAWVASRRDQGAGVIAPRPGRAVASPWIRSPLSLLVRLSLGLGMGWIVATAVFAFAFGYLTQQMTGLTSAAHLGRDTTVDATMVIFIQLNALLAAAAGTQLTQWLAREETSGRVGYALACPVSRRRWWGSATLLVAAWSLLVTVSTGLFTGLGLAAGFGDLRYVQQGLTSTLAYVPAVALVVAIAVVLHSITPRAVPVAWLAIGWGTIVCLRAELLRLPPWARDLSPLHWMGAVPRDAWHRPEALAMTLLAVALLASATLVYQWRDLAAG